MVANNVSEQTPMKHRLKIILFVMVFLAFISGSVLLFESFFEMSLFWLLLLRLSFILLLMATAVTENIYRVRIGPLFRCAVTDKTAENKADQPAFSNYLEFVCGHYLITGLLSTVSLWEAFCGLSETGTVIIEDSLSIPALTSVMVVCFVLLVTERLCAAHQSDWEHQPEVTGLCRIHLNIWLSAAIAVFIVPFLPELSVFILRLACGIAGLVACEFLFRLSCSMFFTRNRNDEPKWLTCSMLAVFYHWPFRPAALIIQKTEQQLGINLSGLQAILFLRRLGLPVLGFILLIGWLSSSLINIPLHQRGIYERMGQPVAVFKPGIHVGLPWPFGNIRLVEYGTVHELQTSEEVDPAATSDTNQLRNDSEDNESEPVVSLANKETAEGDAPQNSWRLWDTSHIGDQSQVIASQNGHKQEFQIMDMDVRLIWRIGLRDQDAFNSTYHVDKLPQLIRDVASQLLVRSFASQQLDTLLSGPQNHLASELNQQIQHQLNLLNAGVDVLSTKIESIHPPAGAADAYHGVQAAQISASALISREHGYMASHLADANIAALTALNQAQADSIETIDRASSDNTLFAAENQAWQTAGPAFLLERHLNMLQDTLGHTPLLILDHHLQGDSAPMLDLRTPELPVNDSAEISKGNNQ